MAKSTPTKPDWLDNPAIGEILDEITPDNSVMTAVEYLTDEHIARLRTPDISVGDIAPDFDLVVYDFSDGTRVETGSTFHLQEVARNLPVALIFGSYT